MEPLIPHAAAPPEHTGRSVAALLLGAVAIGFAPIFVRLSETGPTATAFWRLLLALPVLAVWAAIERKETGSAVRSRSAFRWIVLTGLFFAGDLALWHWSIRFTSVANATLFANFAAIFVVIFSWLFLRERITPRFGLACVAAVAGTVMLFASNVQLVRERLLGDALGIGTAVFYAAYLLAVKKLRGQLSTAAIMSGSAAVSVPALGIVCLFSGETMLPVSGRGWLILIGLSLLSHVAGQSLITYALARLRASFSSVALLLQPFVAALAAWVLLGENITPLQLAGGATILAGIALARPAPKRVLPPDLLV
ncbi:MAG TPA: DMT family transporter [Chthoniobacteraceae bacterium]|nr:DMT family transporter [Chthoniobacteraceae bacterium]